MNTSISYEGQNPPLRGDHRPAWALYGEYLYIPPQRWLHNLEVRRFAFRLWHIDFISDTRYQQIKLRN